jgi:hypothetical protein
VWGKKGGWEKVCDGEKEGKKNCGHRVARLASTTSGFGLDAAVSEKKK